MSNRNSLILVSLKIWKQSYQKSLNQRIWISDNNNIYEFLPKIAEDVFVFSEKKKKKHLQRSLRYVCALLLKGNMRAIFAS